MAVMAILLAPPLWAAAMGSTLAQIRDVSPVVIPGRSRTASEPGIWSLWREIPGLALTRRPGMTERD